MDRHDSTCWTAIRAAAAGSPPDREELARRYIGVVRAYLAARWRDSALRDDLEDALQEVFVECFRQGGALEAAGAGRVPSFRPFLYGVVRNVARRFESRPVRDAGPLSEIMANEASLSQLFDRTWAQAIMLEGGYRAVALDDPKSHRTSEKVWGTCTLHESTARCPNRAETVRVHNWVVAGDLIPGRPWLFLPHSARLYCRAKQLPTGARLDAGRNRRPRQACPRRLALPPDRRGSSLARLAERP